MVEPAPGAAAGELPDNPCVRRCCLDEQDICLGCGRSLQEILDWHGADRPQREAILQRAAERLRSRPGGVGPAPTATRLPKR